MEEAPHRALARLAPRRGGYQRTPVLVEEAPHVSAQSAPDLHVDLEGHGQLEGGLHHLDGEGLERAQLAVRHLEEQLVVHLQQHPAPEAARGQLAGDADHRDLHEIGGGALDGRIGRHALAEAAQIGVAAPQLGEIAPAAEQRRDVAALAALRHRARRDSAFTFGCRAKNWLRYSCACFCVMSSPRDSPNAVTP